LVTAVSKDNTNNQTIEQQVFAFLFIVVFTALSDANGQFADAVKNAFPLYYQHVLEISGNCGYM